MTSLRNRRVFAGSKSGDDEHGMSLVLLLVTITFIGIVFTSILAYQWTALSVQTTLSDKRARDLSVDSALDATIEQTQSNAGWGSNDGGTLNASMTIAATSFVVNKLGTSTAFPPPIGATVRINSEDMLITNASGTGPATLTVTRGYNGTTAATHSAGTAVSTPCNNNSLLPTTVLTWTDPDSGVGQFDVKCNMLDSTSGTFNTRRVHLSATVGSTSTSVDVTLYTPPDTTKPTVVNTANWIRTG